MSIDDGASRPEDLASIPIDLAHKADRISTPADISRRESSAASRPSRLRACNVEEIRIVATVENGKQRPRKSSQSQRRPATQRTRQSRPFPAAGFEDAAVLAEEIQRVAAGQRRIRRLTLFEQPGRSADSGQARQQIVNSNRYGLTTGNYRAEFLELTDKGAAATDPDGPSREQARFELAIADVPAFASLYETLKGNKLPAQQVLRDHLITEQQLTPELAQEAAELFIVNAKHVGVLRPIGGSQRVLTIDHVLDELPMPAAGRNGTSVGGLRCHWSGRDAGDRARVRQDMLLRDPDRRRRQSDPRAREHLPRALGRAGYRGPWHGPTRRPSRPDSRTLDSSPRRSSSTFCTPGWSSSTSRFTTRTSSTSSLSVTPRGGRPCSFAVPRTSCRSTSPTCGRSGST